MKWIVGIDVRGRSGGTVHMAAWLRQHLRADDASEFLAVHVVDEHLRNSAKVMSAVAAAGERALAEAAASTGVDSPFTATRVVFAPSNEAGLAQVAAAEGADGILIGRIARRDGGGLIRLGSVARRLLRQLPVPIMVVPPDLVATDIGGGPVMVATDLGPTAVHAAHTAGGLATALGRELLVAHVDPWADVGRDLIGDASIMAAWKPVVTIAEVDAWVRAHGIAAARTGLSHSGVVEGLLADARIANAAVLVSGSRQLSTVDRLFTSSVGTDLARLADRPVLIVPAA